MTKVFESTLYHRPLIMRSASKLGIHTRHAHHFSLESNFARMPLLLVCCRRLVMQPASKFAVKIVIFIFYLDYTILKSVDFPQPASNLAAVVIFFPRLKVVETTSLPLISCSRQGTFGVRYLPGRENLLPKELLHARRRAARSLLRGAG